MTLANEAEANARYTPATDVKPDRSSHSMIEDYLPAKRDLGLLDDITGLLGPKDLPFIHVMTVSEGRGALEGVAALDRDIEDAIREPRRKLEGVISKIGDADPQLELVATVLNNSV